MGYTSVFLEKYIQFSYIVQVQLSIMYLISRVKMKKSFRYSLLLLAIISLNCGPNIPTATEWLGLRIIDKPYATHLFRTAGKGKASVNWWAGGYLKPGGYFEIHLLDEKSGELLLKKKYAYGDSLTGYADEAVFNWWHAEATDAVSLQANHVYRMKIWGDQMGDVGCGWGLWLYKLGDTPRRRQRPPMQKQHF